MGLGVWSVWWFAWWIGPWGIAVNVSSGGVSFVNWRFTSPVQRGWTIARTPERRFSSSFRLDRGTGGSVPHLRIPLWTFAAATGVGAAAFMWRARKVPVSGCAGCGYDRAGLAPGAACPECGRAARPRYSEA